MSEHKIKLIARSKCFALADKVAETMIHSINSLSDDDAQQIWLGIETYNLHQALSDVDNALYQGDINAVYKAIAAQACIRQEPAKKNLFHKILDRLMGDSQAKADKLDKNKYYCKICQNELGLDSLITHDKTSLVYRCSLCGTQTTLTANLW